MTLVKDREAAAGGLLRKGPQMRQLMFFFDFDNTLYSHTAKKVSDSSLNVLHRLLEAGHTVIIASGRGHESIDMIYRELRYKPEILILLNGQVILGNQSVLFERFIELPSMSDIITIANKNGFAYGGFYAHGMVVNDYNERVKTVWREFGNPLPDLRANFEREFSLYHGHLYIRQEEASIFYPALDEYVTNWSHEHLVNLIPKQAGKSQAIRWCLDYFNIQREDTYAFGDGYNDHDMLLAVGHGIAMGNATEQLKSIAEFVTKSVDEDGIAYAIENYHIF